MGNLIRLELKRFSLKPHLIGLAAANSIILCLSVFSSYLFTSASGEPMAPGLPPLQLDTMAMAAMLVRAVLIVWEAVFLSTLMIEEYRNKTIGLLFTYPVKRLDLILAKLALICGSMLAFHIGSGIFQNVCISFLSGRLDFVTYRFENLFTQTITAISTILLGLFPLFVGMAKKSSIAAVVSSIIIVAVASNTQNAGAGLLSMPLLAVAFGVAGVIFAAAAIKKMLTTDL